MNEEHFPEWSELSSFERQWFSEHLQAAKETPISLLVETEIYRFTWLRSFHAPIVVRVDCDENCVLKARQLSGAGGYSPGHIQIREDRILTNEEASKLRAIAKKIDNWVYEPDEEIIGMDGARWIFEMASGNNYQAWNLWSPGSDKAAEIHVEMCLYLLNLTNLTIEKGHVY
ncbi:hypothetical protein WG68_16315 [Arsukibacterium ikkense]|uniref:Uncharacterized protein n=2 Tax=Arsukibacterium ikkense TaxID=336831 RepID=A0A0M2V1W9_9GAMM|nr:hypothetical protein WG68_16315 [Arsukibacterium ikkense]